MNMNVLPNLKRYAIGLVCLLSAATALADNAVEKQMENMQHEYRLALNSTSIAQLRRHVVLLQQYTDAATTFTYGKTPSTQAAYKDHMHELQADLEEVTMAVSENNLTLAKQLLQQQVNQTKKTAHTALRVEEDDEDAHASYTNHEKHKRD